MVEDKEYPNLFIDEDGEPIEVYIDTNIVSRKLRARLTQIIESRGGYCVDSIPDTGYMLVDPRTEDGRLYLALNSAEEDESNAAVFNVVCYTFVAAALQIGRRPSMDEMKDVTPIFEKDGKPLNFYIHEDEWTEDEVNRLRYRIALYGGNPNATTVNTHVHIFNRRANPSEFNDLRRSCGREDGQYVEDGKWIEHCIKHGKIKHSYSVLIFKEDVEESEPEDTNQKPTVSAQRASQQSVASRHIEQGETSESKIEDKRAIDLQRASQQSVASRSSQTASQQSQASTSQQERPATSDNSRQPKRNGGSFKNLDEDLDHLAQFLAEELPDSNGRQGQTLYDDLTSEKYQKKYPWAGRRSAQAWRGVYRNHKDRLDPLIDQRQAKMNKEQTATHATKVKFTKKDNERIASFLAKENPLMQGRRGRKIWESLCSEAMAEKYPWASRHPTSSWGTYYRNHAESIDQRVAEIISEDRLANRARRREPDVASAVPRVDKPTTRADSIVVEQSASDDGNELTANSESREESVDIVEKDGWSTMTPKGKGKSETKKAMVKGKQRAKKLKSGDEYDDTESWPIIEGQDPPLFRTEDDDDEPVRSSAPAQPIPSPGSTAESPIRINSATPDPNAGLAPIPILSSASSLPGKRKRVVASGRESDSGSTSEREKSVVEDLLTPRAKKMRLDQVVDEAGDLNGAQGNDAKPGEDVFGPIPGGSSESATVIVSNGLKTKQSPVRRALLTAVLPHSPLKVPNPAGDTTLADLILNNDETVSTPKPMPYSGLDAEVGLKTGRVSEGTRALAEKSAETVARLRGLSDKKEAKRAARPSSKSGSLLLTMESSSDAVDVAVAHDDGEGLATEVPGAIAPVIIVTEEGVPGKGNEEAGVVGNLYLHGGSVGSEVREGTHSNHSRPPSRSGPTLRSRSRSILSDGSGRARRRAHRDGEAETVDAPGRGGDGFGDEGLEPGVRIEGLTRSRSPSRPRSRSRSRRLQPASPARGEAATATEELSMRDESGHVGGAALQQMTEATDTDSSLVDAEAVDSAFVLLAKHYGIAPDKLRWTLTTLAAAEGWRR